VNQLTVIDDVAARRTAAARKAWETRRAQGWIRKLPNPGTEIQETTAAQEALARFAREAESEAPDWHGAAVELRRALERQDTRKNLAPRPPKPAALPPSRWHDYPVDRVGSFNIRTDILVVTFADGEVVRAPAVSARGKPTNVGRGLRIAIAFYQARACRRRGIKFRPGVHEAVPAIEACICEDSGETFDTGECTLRTIEDRKSQDWRLRRENHRGTDRHR